MSTPESGMPETGTPQSGGAGESQLGRLEAFSDGVLAVIITIMALELRAPAGDSFRSLRERIPALLIYILSFTFVGIYWNNHHHLLRAARRLTDKLVPAATYGVVCLASALAFTVLAVVITRADGPDSPVAVVSGQSIKSQASLVLYAGGTVVAFFFPWIAYIMYGTVSVIWFIPDPRLGRLKDL